VPVSWFGGSYQYFNWNRFSFRDSLLLADGRMYIAGKMGVFYSSGAGVPFQELNDGFPESLYLRDTNTLLGVEHNGQLRLFAGGRSGLYYRDHDSVEWRQIPLQGSHGIVDLLNSGKKVLAFSAHGCFSAGVEEDEPLFRPLHLQLDTKGKNIPGYRLLFELHSGKLFGLPGRLLVDFSALILLFLSVSALYIWFVPWQKRRTGNTGKRNRLYVPFYLYHLKFGIWIGCFLFILGGTGALVRPPLILLSSYWQIPFSWLIQDIPEILKVALPNDGSLVIATRDGWFRGKADLSEIFQPIYPPLPVFGMGATVVKPLQDNELLIGSFSGLYRWNPNRTFATDMMGKRAEYTAQVRPGEMMVAGVLVADGVLAGYADYKKGLVEIDGKAIVDRPSPVGLVNNRSSLYHFLFELHNGRLFRDLLGSFYILYVPLLGMGLMLIVCTGVIGWLKRKQRRLRRRRKVGD